MAEVTLDTAEIAKLHHATEYFKLRDDSGKVIGYFVPVDTSAPKALWGVKSLLPPEERAERMKEERGITLKEFWTKMRETHPDKFQLITRSFGIAG